MVVGGGPAGLSAASWLGRYRRTVLVVDSGEYRNRWTEHAHGYLGLDPVAPSDLRRRAHQQVLAYPTVRIRPGRVDDLEGAINRFDVVVDGAPIQARRVVLATGISDAFPEVEGFFDHYGASVFHCSSCDGYEARHKEAVVLGWGSHVAGFACELLEWASSVTVVTEGRTFEGDAADRARLEASGIAMVEDDAVALRGSRGDLRGVRLASGVEIGAQMLFFSIAHHPHTELASALGCTLTDEGYVAVDAEGHTSVAGVFAAGDLTPGTQLVVMAAASGATAGIHCALSLRSA
ncbi:MAG TPA: NAD(P)/FAD-dependent oxidoreductase [Acidimicrobiales bacterium]|nr:NAD(P)/FAD-dependent oxidoreductase [Acidimicrobiales bacterium]